MVVTQDLEIIRSVQTKNFDQFINRAFTPPMLRKPNKESINVRGLLFAENEEWRRMRRILTPTFSSKKLRMMVPLIQNGCQRLNEKMSAVSNSGENVDMWKWFGLFTMETILSTAFSRDIDTQKGSDNPIAKAAASLFNSTATSNERFEMILTVLSHFPWMEWLLAKFARQTQAAKNFDYLEDTALKLIEDRRRSMSSNDSPPQDLLQTLLEAHDEKEAEKGTSGCLSNYEIVVNIITILAAGYETTSNALGYTAYLLALNPTVQDRLTLEIQDYYGANPDASLYDAAENIDYVTMVLNESMRLYPPIPRTNRECNQTCAVSDNLVILEGVNISFPIFLIHRNPKYWPNPDKFDPERFKPGEQSYPSFAYLPFGEGPRNCIGK